MYEYLNGHMNVWVRIYMSVGVCECVCMSVCVCMSLCVYECMCV